MQPLSMSSDKPQHAIRALCGFAKPFRMQIGLLLALGVLSALLEGVGLGLLVPILHGLTTDGPPISGNPVIDFLSRPFLAVAAEKRLQVLMLALLSLTVLKNGMIYTHTVLTTWLRANLIRHLRCRIFDQFLRVGYQYVTERRSGDLYNDLVNETNRTGQVMASLVQQVAIVLVAVICAGLLVAISWPLFLLVVGILGALSLLLGIVVKKTREAGELTSHAYARHASVTLEGLAAMRVIRLFGREDFERGRFADAVRLANRADLRSAAFKSLMAPLSEIVAMGLFTLILFAAARVFIRQADALLPLLLTFLFILYRLMPRVNQFNNNRATIANNLPAVGPVLHVLSPEGKPSVKSGSRCLKRLEEGIRLEGVGFCYGAGNDQVLTDVSFEIPAGKTTAIVGASGAGKSTLVDLIPRFYDPSSGRITADGYDIRTLDLAAWRAAIGVVSQDTFVFNASVRDNIAYGRLEATDEEVEDASQRANAFEFISKMPKGFHTLVGERGVRLSGGQRQRIAIARAVLRNPKILILDEATSALDTASERLVQEALDELRENRTVLVVAHRLSTIVSADQIIVLENGRVVEAGAHQVLLANRGAYWRYYSMQFNRALA